ncbi:MAG: ABC transporter substrate-binding protein [Clostridiales bacterium]|nr:ABC transporter substrate-binding protein [Clostridiales bacterium]
MKKILSIVLVLVLAVGLLSGCGGSKGTIKVGILGCHTGEYAQYGMAVQNGVMLYIEKLNASGGVNGKQIETIIYDDKGDGTEAVTAFNRMVDDGITALIGSVLSGSTMAVVGESSLINMPQISASATAAGVTVGEDGKVFTNMFRTCFIDPFQGEKMAQYASEILKAKTAAAIFETGNDYAVGLKDAFVAKCETLGITVVADEGYSKGDKDFKSQLTNINAKGADVIFCPNYYEDDGLIVTQARQIGIKSTFLGGDGWAKVSEYASAADLEGSVYCSPYAPGSSDAVKQFEAEYSAKYNETAGMFAALGYDAAIVMTDALKKAEEKGLKAGKDDYKAAVIDAMKNTSSVGITSTYAFDEFNNPIKQAVIIKIEGGKENFSQMF